jgi:hypothetical protein
MLEKGKYKLAVGFGMVHGRERLQQRVSNSGGKRS